MTATLTPRRPGSRAGWRHGFGWQLRAEWTKFRTVRGWVAGMAAAALVTVALGLLFAGGMHTTCGEGAIEERCPVPPTGPSGAAVEDRFYFAHRELTGDGAITARLTAMTGIITYPPPGHDQIVSGLVPWAKAGIMIKESTRQGSAYAAMMLTGRNGVRMQYDFVHDIPGRAGTVSAKSPRWLRLTRSGGTLTGYESPDGERWTKVGTARPAGLPRTVRIGLFVASPGDLTVRAGPFGGSGQVRFTQASGVFDQVALRGATSGGAWRGEAVGDDGMRTDWERYHRPAGVLDAGGTLTVTGSGDIAPLLQGRGFEGPLNGVAIALIPVIVVAVMFVTGEYRRGLIRTTLLTTPRRGHILAAKAVVIGGVTFVAALAASAVVLPLGLRVLRANGNYILPVSSLTELRVILGAAIFFALTAVLALALGALFRRGAATTAAIALIVLPYLLAVAALPEGAARWLMRLTPAAGFAILQSVPEYPQVVAHYAPSRGFYPLPPWAGLGVLAAYTALALGLAAARLRRRDA
ncbi:ABC transporter permease subunit [Sphaerisporangium aureirubrum]|uniref:ABC transporter permease subunit n=1 Tax=Sphaerisporangium aureirubrum TaxID=1544736 RepID=A0ABW1NK49_9ACTN